MNRFTWFCVVGGVITAISGCSSSLREVRAREPEFRFPGILLLAPNRGTA
jgi:hypothetical protein